MNTTFLFTKENKHRMNFIYSFSNAAIGQLKLFVPKAIERSMKAPALGFLDFLAETYSFLNQSEYKYIYRTKYSKYCFLFKYCSLSFLSFYL